MVSSYQPRLPHVQVVKVYVSVPCLQRKHTCCGVLRFAMMFYVLGPHFSMIFLHGLVVRSLANASRARQFIPLNPPGVGWVPLPQTNMAAVVGRARSCVRGRSCVVVRGSAWSCVVVRGRARSCVRGRSCVVVCAWSCVVVPFCPLRGQHCRDTNERRNERTTSNNPLNPPGVEWVKFFYPIKVRVSMGTCVPNLGAIRRPVRKICLSNLFISRWTSTIFIFRWISLI